MSFEKVGSVLNINNSAIMTLALASVLYLIGYAIRNKSKALRKYCIPAPVIGGFLFMLITFVGHVSGTFKFTFDTYFQSPFMLAFFTTVGLGASVELIKKGGKLLIIYWLIACFVSVVQNIIGIGVGKTIGLQAPYALLASAISMVGGHGAAGAYGKTFEEMGYTAAQLAGAASATFGLISSVMVGGPIASRLVRKNNLKAEDDAHFDDSDIQAINAATGKELTSLDVMKNVAAIIICMAVGTMVSGWVSKLINMGFPTYVGAMFVAVIVRNLNEKFKFYHFEYPMVEKIGDVSLALYLSIALMSLRLWELADIVGGLAIVLLAQVLFLTLFTYFIVFRLLGKNYDAAVMCAGLLGHGLGATPTAIVNMTATTEEYGMSRRAFMIVPIVGAFLVDIIYQPATLWFIKTFVENPNPLAP